VGLTPSSSTWAPAAVTQRINSLGGKADHLSLSSSEIKNVWSYTFTAPHVYLCCAEEKLYFQLHGITSYMIVKFRKS
jgi:hypothetical protein